MAAPEKLKIGELLVREGYITQQQLDEAISLQRSQKVYKPIGELLVELKYIYKPDLKRILRKHQKQIRLGDLLVNLDLISAEKLIQALDAQKKEGGKLGEILLKKEFITEAALVEGLSVQLGVKKILPDLSLIDRSLLQGINESFLRKNDVIPAFKENGTITVIMANPLDEDTVRDLKLFFKCEIDAALALSKDIQKTLDQYYSPIGFSEKALAPAVSDDLHKDLMIGDVNLSKEGGGSIIRVLDFLVTNAVEEGASDIHIEPLDKSLRIRYRVDGILYHKTDLPITIAPNLVSRIKILCKMDIAERRKHQDGRIEARVLGREVDLRVSTYSSLYGENVVLRILYRQTSLIELESLGFSPSHNAKFTNILHHPTGLILVTGPTGSGKTTTLYASIYYLNAQNRSIVTVEDPVENIIDGVTQGQLKQGTDQSYMDFIKSMMRQDPDVIMVGEIRDKEAAEAVIQVALTDHKVLTIFHTDDTTGALLRLMDMGIDTFLISSTVVSIVSQRLVRTLCHHCKEKYVPDQRIFSSFNITPIDLDAYIFYQPKGCQRCNGTGFKGRTAVHELMVVNDAIRDAILERKTSTQIRNIARKEAQLISMMEDGFWKATKGLTTLEEVLRLVFQNEGDRQTARSAEEIVALCEGKEIAISAATQPSSAPVMASVESIKEAERSSEIMPPASDIVTRAPIREVDRSADIIPLKSATREEEVYQVRFDCQNIEFEKDYIKDLFAAYQDVRAETDDPLDTALLDDFTRFIIDNMKRLRLQHKTDFADVCIRVRGKKALIFAEPVIPEKHLDLDFVPSTKRSTRFEMEETQVMDPRRKVEAGLALPRN